jgi:hypothetical protein
MKLRLGVLLRFLSSLCHKEAWNWQKLDLIRQTDEDWPLKLWKL